MRRLPLLLLALVAAPVTVADDLSDRFSNRTTEVFYFKKPLFRGSVLHQNQPASGGPAPKINWWVVGGVAVGAAVVIHQENKEDRAPPGKFGGKGGS